MRFILGWESLARYILHELKEVKSTLKRMDDKMSALDPIALKVTELQGTVTDLKADNDAFHASFTTLIAKVKELKEMVAAGSVNPADVAKIVGDMDAAMTVVKDISAQEKTETTDADTNSAE